jgi:hypothetical protein
MNFSRPETTRATPRQEWLSDLGATVGARLDHAADSQPTEVAPRPLKSRAAAPDRGPLADPTESTEESVRRNGEALFSGRLPWSHSADDLRRAIAYAGAPRGRSKIAALRWVEKLLDGLLMAHELNGRGEVEP